MYIPATFRETDIPRIHAAIRASGLATLITTGASGMLATPVPMLIDPAPAPYGTLYGHIARANPQWQQTDQAMDALAIFLGPDAYVSPGWYPSKRETGKVVPTWNYVTVHAYGPVEFISDPDILRGFVADLTRKHEAGRAQPWQVSDAPADFIASQLRAIVGFRLRITRLEGKWKMSQNRLPADREAVVEGLRAEGTAQAAVVADLVAAALRDKK